MSRDITLVRSVEEALVRLQLVGSALVRSTESVGITWCVVLN